jgi:hypothetical protein
MKRMVIGLALLLLSGCAAQPTMSPQQVAAIKTIGIVSAIGDDMMTLDIPNFFNIGTTAAKGSITYLGLDPYLIGQIGDRLKDRFQIVPVTYQSQDFRADRLKPSIGDVIHHKTSLPSGGPVSVDAYIVATTTNVEVLNTGRHVRGAFLAKLPAIGKDEYVAGVIYTMTVIDGHDFKTIANTSILDHDDVAASYWTDDINNMTPRQRKNLQDELQSQLTSTVRPALKRLPFVE